MRLIDRIRAWLRGRPSPPTPPPPVPPAPPPAGVTRAVLAAVNARRARPLAWDDRLARAAQGWADELARRGGSPAHGDFMTRIRAAGYPGVYVGEDIAAGQRSAEEVVADWMSDPPHRRSVTDPLFHSGGVGVAGRPGGWTYYVLDLGGE